MAEYITQIQENGNVMISEDVVSTIATHAIQEVEGVVSLSTKPGSDIADHIPPQNPCRRMRAGVIVCALRTKKTAGETRIIAECEHLLPASLTIAVPSQK